MKTALTGLRAGLLIPTLLLSGGLLSVTSARSADAAARHRSFAQRHPHLTTAAAGYAAYKISKRTGRGRTMHGRHRNFAQRHPVATGVAAAAVAHHMVKKHR